MCAADGEDTIALVAEASRLYFATERMASPIPLYLSTKGGETRCILRRKVANLISTWTSARGDMRPNLRRFLDASAGRVWMEFRVDSGGSTEVFAPASALPVQPALVYFRRGRVAVISDGNRRRDVDRVVNWMSSRLSVWNSVEGCDRGNRQCVCCFAGRCERLRGGMAKYVSLRRCHEAR